ncbi:Hypothetical protein NocV09_00103870 [Nannochloropsis oceanica]
MPSAIPPSTATAVASAAITAGRKGRLAQAFGKMTVACPAQIRAYGACISAKLEAGAQGVERGECEAEFAALRTCFQTQLQALRKSGGRKF